MTKPKGVALLTPIEVTLPSGTFARIGPVTFLDRLAATLDSHTLADTVPATSIDFPDGKLGTLGISVAALISRTVLFDDARLTVVQVLAMDARDTDALLEHFNRYLGKPIL